MNKKINYNELVKISETLEKNKDKDWDNHVETLYVDYIISVIEGSYDTDDLSDIYVDKKEYDKGYNKFYSAIDNALEEELPTIRKENENIYNNNDFEI